MSALREEESVSSDDDDDDDYDDYDDCKKKTDDENQSQSSSSTEEGAAVESSSSDSSTHESGTGSSTHEGGGDDDDAYNEVQKLSKRETERIQCCRFIVVLVILVTGLVISAGTWIFLQGTQNQSYTKGVSSSSHCEMNGKREINS